jgi:DNA uptake protein ComE-like DNA-binding protein
MSARAGRPAGRATLLAVVAGCMALAWSIVDDAPRAAAADPTCRPAVVVAGTLRCGAQQVRAGISQWCPSAIDVADGDVWDAECRRTRMSPSMLAQLGVAVDINAASPDELTSLPGIGPALARRIAAGRPFTSAEQLQSVRGIGPATWARIRTRVRVTAQPGAR